MRESVIFSLDVNLHRGHNKLRKYCAFTRILEKKEIFCHKSKIKIRNNVSKTNM